MDGVLEDIKKARIAKGWSQTEVADKLGIGLRQYQNIEAGQFPKYKRQQIQKLESILDIKIYESIYEEDIHEGSLVEKPQTSYLKQRQNKKNNSGPVMVPLVSVSAQAGYSKSYDNTDFLNKLELYPILPGIDPHGAIWRYFQIDGDSMKDTFDPGDYVLSSQVPKEDWPDLKDFLVYVIVTDAKVLIKRIAKRKSGKEWVTISDNEKYAQFILNPEEVKELWKYRRHIGWNAAAPKRIEIKV